MDERCNRLVVKAEDALSKGIMASAQMAMNKIRRQFPDAPELAILDAQFAFSSGDIISGTEQLLTLSYHTDWAVKQYTKLLQLLIQFELHFAAIRVLRMLNRLAPDTLDYKIKLADLLLQTGEINASLSLLGECCEARPDDASLYLLLGHAYKALPDTEKAATAYHRYIALQPASAGAGFWSLADLKNYTFTAQDQTHIENADAATVYQQALLYFAQHHQQHQAGNYQAAMQRLADANTRMSKERPFYYQGFRRLVDDLHALKVAPDTYSSEITPIFIVGLPRSGTTLTEQILAAHSRVATTDELPYIERIALYLSQQGRYPAGLDQISQEEKDRLRDFYLRQAKQYNVDEAEFVIDKNPNNILHLGLIHTLFPNAHIICLSRPVIDNAVSLYRQFFYRGNEYAYTPADISCYIESFYRLLSLWQGKLGKHLHILNYQTLVEAPEQTIRALLDALALPFEDGCLNFYQADTPVLTPSASQVRQPINKNSMGTGSVYLDVFNNVSPSITQLEKMRSKLLSE